MHGYIRITEVEKEVIDSPFVQRLRRVHQLAGSYLVYPGAVHTRFEHVIGAMHIAGKIGQSLAEASHLDSDSLQELRLGALLHDVGHGPFSHMYEEVLAPKKISHEDITRRIIVETNLRDILERHGFDPTKISGLSVGKQKSAPAFMNEVIAGGLSADMMDYLLRDSHFTGAEFGMVDVQRIVNSLRASGGHLALERAALHTFEALLLARYQMFKAVYFHRTVRAAELMLVHAMELADETLGLTDLSDLDSYLDLTDEVVLHRLSSLSPSSPDLRRAKQLAIDFRNRKLVKCAFEHLFQRRDRRVQQLFARSRVRRQTVQALAESARVDAVDILLDVPTTPSVPYTSSSEELRSVRLIGEGRDRRTTNLPISKLPLVGSIAGFMDVLRIYAPSEVRERVERAASAFFGKESSLLDPSF